jgi:hypothetical protein
MINIWGKRYVCPESTIIQHIHVSKYHTKPHKNTQFCFYVLVKNKFVNKNKMGSGVLGWSSNLATTLYVTLCMLFTSKSTLPIKYEEYMPTSGVSWGLTEKVDINHLALLPLQSNNYSAVVNVFIMMISTYANAQGWPPSVRLADLASLWLLPVKLVPLTGHAWTGCTSWRILPH